MSYQHTPVLYNEVLEGLSINLDPYGIYVDGTVGGGGHAAGIAAKLGSKGLLIGIDRDEEAIEAAREHLAEFGERVKLIHGNYRDTKQILAEHGINKTNGMLLDLGVSSHQLDQAERGFSYTNDTILDMRMDKRQSKSAYNIINEYTEAELHRILRDYGEERFAKNIVKHITRAREEKPIASTGRLNEIIASAIPAQMRSEGGHPSKRTYQAIRIECNDELHILEETLDELIGLLSTGGRLVIITFHSLEDRIVKTAFKKNEKPCTCPASFPVCVCGKESKGHVITKKPIVASSAEQERNSRAKSAKLRIFERK
jgi:16S rRNA (cytosine1402-N4)-methyltransferase